MVPWKPLLFIALIGIGGYHWWTTRPVSHGPGVLATEAPVQRELSDASPFVYKGYRITPLARFTLDARVLSREDYSLGREGELSPTDLALGWGRMSDQAVLDRMEIRQSNRFFYWSVKEFSIPQREIEISAANMHMIPADNTVARALSKVRAGQIVHLRGKLVRIDKDDWHWVSSLSREDAGAGACELIWVEELSAQ